MQRFEEKTDKENCRLISNYFTGGNDYTKKFRTRDEFFDSLSAYDWEWMMHGVMHNPTFVVCVNHIMQLSDTLTINDWQYFYQKNQNNTFGRKYCKQKIEELGGHVD